ncbi:protein of unknown function [Candidatus Filomicrobium marinum]|uniref:Uncharacterized protein n=1 Tax=Candidatus Filomicrobium marinum TaxID=1608628 RepID=A0A0D6JE23_9HYPH|nr:protein of unknown function [Candidatus Filomicrobium marinum]CPR18113.1 protein of unknown function [Candidatus Filomicrobium marinum]
MIRGTAGPYERVGLAIRAPCVLARPKVAGTPLVNLLFKQEETREFFFSATSNFSCMQGAIQT